MFSRIVILLVFLAAASEVCAQTLTVVSKDSGIPLPAAAVRVFADTGTRVLMHTEETDEQGTVQLTVPVLPAVVEVQRSGYEQELVKLKAIPTELRVSLTPRLHVMDEVVVTGVPSPIKLQDALASYRVITAATIQAQGAVTLNEALANQLNLSVGNDALLGAGIRMQGMNGDKVKTLMDGVALNGREGGNIDMGQINLYNAERIEVVQGPMSIIYGSDALGGVINVIEKQRRRPFEAFATAHYESIGKYNVQAGLSKAWKRHRLQAGGGRNYFQGWKYLDEPVGYNQDTVQAQRHMLFKPKEQYLANLGYQYQSAKGTKIRFASDLLREKVTNKGAVRTFNPFTVAATDEYYRTTRSVNRLTLEGKLKERLSWQIINGYTYYRRVRTTYEKDLTTLAQTLSEASGVQDTSLFQDYASRGMFSGNAGSRLAVW